MKEFQLEIIRIIQRLQGDLLNQVFEAITYIGEDTIVIAVITFIYLVYDKKVGQKVIYISIFSMLVNAFFKLSVKAPRPIGEPGITSIRVETAGGYSFPSGHSQNTATMLTWLALIIKKTWFKIVALVAILLVMFSRLYLGVHYPIDAIVGALLGFLISCYIFKYYDQLKHPRLVVAIVMIVYLPIAIYFGLTDAAMADELFKMYGLLIGSFLGFMFEEKYVNFTMNTSKWKALIRYICGISIALGLQMGLKYVFPESNLGDLCRYFMIAFIALGLYPYLFKKLRF